MTAKLCFHLFVIATKQTFGAISVIAKQAESRNQAYDIITPKYRIISTP